ncbi:metallophosphoesterase [Rhizobium leguminosarum]
MGNLEPLWPTTKHAFFDDIRKLHTKNGPIDFVIFAGDIAQKGLTPEYDRFNEIISELWKVFSDLGSKPALIALPGNHDLARPSDTNPAAPMLKQWWDQPAARNIFFEGANSYRTLIEDVFSSYTAWTKSSLPEGITLLGDAQGILPGDSSTVIEQNGIRVGVVCLNSTWLQLDEKNYEGKLHVDIRQLNAVTGGDPVAWCRANDLNILVTHHPLGWLEGTSRKAFDSEINPPGRFDLHVYGHMHAAVSEVTSNSGSQPRITFQSRSVFGLEYFGDQITERSHGYSWFAHEQLEDVERLVCRPRLFQRHNSGKSKIIPDYNFDLEDDGSFELFSRKPILSKDEPLAKAITSVPALSGKTAGHGSLKSLRYFLHPSPAHRQVRYVEQRRAGEAIATDRALWIVSDWGMAGDEFLTTIQENRETTVFPTFALDLSDFAGTGVFLGGLKASVGASFEALCQELAEIGPSYLLLEHFPVGQPRKPGTLHLEEQVEELIGIVKDYSPSTVIVIRARKTPSHAKFPVIELRSLEEADLKSYVAAHEKGGTKYISSKSVSGLFSLTDGVPQRVDQALKDLQLVSLSELVQSNADVVATAGGEEIAPPALRRVIARLSTATEVARKRSFDLLKALTMFPRGEQLSRLHRFNGADGFKIDHARELLDEALVDVVNDPNLQEVEVDSDRRVLAIPRPIREYVVGLLQEDEFRSLSKRAADLYFGKQWEMGKFKKVQNYRFDQPTTSAIDIANASTIVLRLVKDAIDEADLRAMERAQSVAVSFVTALIVGTHYRGVVLLVDNLLPLISTDKTTEKISRLKRLWGRSLRMVGDHSHAIQVLEEIKDHKFSKADEQSLQLDLALAYQSNGDHDKAKEAVERIFAIDKQTHTAFHGRAILLQIAEDDPNRFAKLAKLEVQARRRGAARVANNIALYLAANKVSEVRPGGLEHIIQTAARDNDFYNGIRATLQVAEQLLGKGQKPPQAMRDRLVAAYHYLFAERFASLFDRCHSVLWRIYKSENDLANLFGLFRHSSFQWRLRGDDRRETQYLNQLADAISQNGLLVDGRTIEVSYYRVRQEQITQQVSLADTGT